MAKNIILAIDEGTTGVTALLVYFSELKEPKVVGRATVDFPQHFPESGWVEHDLNEIWTAMRKSIELAFFSTKGLYSKDDIVAIGITNQRETLCVFDRATSLPLCHAIVWQCRRSQQICETLRKNGYEESVQQKTGLLLDPYFSGTKISWLMQNNPHVRTQIESGRAVFGTIDSFLIHRLTGGKALVTESSNASRTMLYNLNGRWDQDLITLFNVPGESSLPEVKSTAGFFGATLGLDFLPDGIPITGVIGDQQGALAGQTCFDIGQAKATYGTGAFLLVNTGSKIVYSKSKLLTTIAWNVDGSMTYAIEGACFVAGSAMQFLRDQLHILKHAAESEGLASSVRAAPDLYFVPALTGLGAPYWDANARGAFLGLHRGTTEAELVRAALEGIAFQVTDLANAMNRDLERETNDHLKILRVDGGAANNNFLMQLQSDLLKIPVERPQNVETTAMGAALFAALGCGIFSSLNELNDVRSVDKTFMPTSDHATCQNLQQQIKGWHRAVECVQVFSGAKLAR